MGKSTLAASIAWDLARGRHVFGKTNLKRKQHVKFNLRVCFEAGCFENHFGNISEGTREREGL